MTSPAPTLLTLPQEILLQICEYSLPTTISVGKNICRHAGQMHRPHRIHKAPFTSQMPTLYTCRLLSQLTSSVLYTVPAYHLHVASPSIRWQSRDRHWQDVLLNSHGGELRKVMLFIELHRGILCCNEHCPEPGNFSRERCIPRHRITQGGAIYLCVNQLREMVTLLLNSRKMKIEELVVGWSMSPWISGHHQNLARTVLEPLSVLRGWVTNVSLGLPGWESADWVYDIVSDLVLKETE
ncbi:uncharacterized protein LY89DRAFT_692497 [Mollisia scopiformis]|uniref:F-box domain-containing protein n=1 Tax=Mollisia scopiformis TaxID=149040 RepID=A0A132B292_MOLSC|nr:uncharacterized protein LY89DRAFT_692497 [Mollisia scopiformis]KUJ06363.1 hypothetical protein LY89DRAFT_692497 [Mollisia scopiformis]